LLRVWIGDEVQMHYVVESFLVFVDEKTV
jgi:hypothetical protein